MTDEEIYLQTAVLAKKIGESFGYTLIDDVKIRHNHPNPRARKHFEIAAMCQEFLCGHKMADVIGEIEEHTTISDHEQQGL